MKKKLYVIVRELVRFYYLFIRQNKKAYAKYLGVRMGEDCQILADPKAAFGTEPWLIKLGNHVDVTSGVQFLTHEGGIWCARGINSELEDKDMFLPITVGNNVLLGSDSLIMPGVHIGDNVIIAARSVVTKDVPDGAVMAGIPAKQISAMDKFMENIMKKELVPTKKMLPPQKREYLQRIHPEWFR